MPKWLEFVVDAVWPTIVRRGESPPGDAELPVINDDAMLDAVERFVRERTDVENHRFESIHGRLLPLLALASVIGTLLTAGIPLAITGRIKGLNDLQLILILIPLAYVAVELVRCLSAALSGLSRRAYEGLSTKALIPVDAETAKTYRHRIVADQFGCLQYNIRVNDQVLNQMALAHTALRNVLWGIAALAVAGIIVAGIERWSDSDSAHPDVSDPTPTGWTPEAANSQQADPVRYRLTPLRPLGRPPVKSAA